MSEYPVLTLPVVDNPELRKLAEIRQAVQEGEFDQVYSESQIIQNEFEEEEKELLELRSQAEAPPRHSKNIESLYQLTLVIDAEMKSIMQPNFTGKLRVDNVIKERINQYYTVRIKQYARQIRIYISSLITVDGFSKDSFVGYEKLEELVAQNNGMKSEEFLLKLLNIARQVIPPDLHTANSFVVDSNAVDPNKVNEG